MPTLTHATSALAAPLTLLLALTGCNGERLGLGEERVDDKEAENTERMWQAIESTMRARASAGDGAMRRFNQAKSLGCFEGRLEVAKGLPPRLAQGIFATPASYPALVRFAAAREDDDRDKDLYGLSISVGGQDPRATISGASSQDFLLNSYPALFAADADDFRAFAEAAAKDRLWAYFFNPLDPHLKSLLLVLRARSNPDNPFAIRYFSTTPFRHGDDTATAVKYAVAPCAPIPAVAPIDDPDRLSDAMAQHLAKAPACFDFLVQFQTDAETMPVEDASVIWPEDTSPFLTVGRLIIAAQPFREPLALQRCERLAFNPWNALPAHRPLGGINRARKSIYTNAARLRSTHNSN